VPLAVYEAALMSALWDSGTPGCGWCAVIRRDDDGRTAIAGLKSLRRVYFWGQENLDLSALAELPQLEELRLTRIDTTDLGPLSSTSLEIILDSVKEVAIPETGFRPKVRRIR
jgi:hypothetical protein